MSINKDKVKRAFSKSSCTYDQNADVQLEMICQLVERLPNLRGKIIDVGAGTGLLARLLVEKFPTIDITAIDLAPGMVALAQKNRPHKKIHYLVADGENLPFNDKTFDYVVSNASYQWMEPALAFSEAARVLKPGGQFYFTTFGPKTLIELKTAGWPVNQFCSQAELKTELKKHFKQVQLGSIAIKKTYADVYGLLATLKAIGSQNQSSQRQQGLVTKKKIMALFPNSQAGVLVTYEVINGFGCNVNLTN